MGLRWHTLVVDCHDADGLAAWWAEVLGWRRLPVGGEGVVIAPPEVADPFGAASPEGRGPGMIFVCPRSLNSGPGMLFENWAMWLV